jgi:hypothetical protein
MKATLNTINSDQTVYIEKSMRHLIGQDTISKMNKETYTKLANNLCSIIFTEAAMPNENIDGFFDINVQDIKWNDKDEMFIALYY